MYDSYLADYVKEKVEILHYFMIRAKTEAVVNSDQILALRATLRWQKWQSQRCDVDKLSIVILVLIIARRELSTAAFVAHVNKCEHERSEQKWTVESELPAKYTILGENLE